MASQRVAVFGSGLVASPVIRFFNRLGVKQVVATRTPSKVEPLVKLLENPEMVEVVSCDVTRDKSLVASLVARSDAVASLLPASKQFPVLEQCVAQGVSGVIPSVAAEGNSSVLDEPARKAGVLILDEIGQSPGMDHMDTMRLAALAHSSRGKIRGYTSLTGSLATVEGLDNPLETKLTWSPRDWLMHSWHSARYLEKGSPVDVPSNELFLPNNLGTDDYPGLGDVAWFLNRDSTMYTKLYGLNDVMMAKRGVHDYPRAMPFLRALQQMGLTSLQAMSRLSELTHLQFCQQILNTKDIKGGVHSALESCEGINADEILKQLDHIGLLSSVIKVPENSNCALDVVASALNKITIQAGEPDSAVNKQIMQVEMGDGSWEEWRSTLEVHGKFMGEEDDSATAKATGLPVAVAVQLLLEKKLPHDIVGIHSPVLPDLYNPILARLEELGMQCNKTSKSIPPMV